MMKKKKKEVNKIQKKKIGKTSSRDHLHILIVAILDLIAVALNSLLTLIILQTLLLHMIWNLEISLRSLFNRAKLSLKMNWIHPCLKKRSTNCNNSKSSDRQLVLKDLHLLKLLPLCPIKHHLRSNLRKRIVSLIAVRTNKSSTIRLRSSRLQGKNDNQGRMHYKIL